MIKKILSIVVLFGLVAPAFCQNLDEMLEQIDLKLRKDKNYLNLYKVVFPNNKINETLTNLPRTNYKDPVSFEAKDNITYEVVFLMDAIGVDSTVLLYVDKIEEKGAGGEQFFGETTGPTRTTERILTYKDLYSLASAKPQAYMTLYSEVRKFIRENPDNPPTSLLKISPDNDIKTSLGISSRDNTDFLNYQRANSLQYYPKAKVDKKLGKRGSTAAVDSIDYRIEAGFTSISFSHKDMDFSFGGAGVEVGVEENILNLLPFQQMSINGGFRLYVNLSEKKEDLAKSTIIDLKMLGRYKVNMSDLPTSLPFMGGTQPKLLLSNAAGVDFTITRPFGLPTINFAAMSGSTDLSNSPVKQTINKKLYTFYSNTQAQATMAFFWNTSESMTSRFCIEVGAGYYDVYSGLYANASASKPSVKVQVQNDFFPLIALHYNFSPEGKDLYGGTVKVFDSQIKTYGWFKLLELDGGHVFRLGIIYITPPFARHKRDWETNGGALVQLRYRYGF
jgi:hypothetical protein